MMLTFSLKVSLHFETLSMYPSQNMEKFESPRKGGRRKRPSWDNREEQHISKVLTAKHLFKLEQVLGLS